MLEAANDIPLFSLSSIHTTNTEMSSPSPPVSLSREPNEPFAVASCPSSPVRTVTRRASFLGVSQLRTIVKRLNPKARLRRVSSLTNPRHLPLSTTVRAKRLTPCKPLIIHDAAFFLPIAQAENGCTDGADAEGENWEDFVIDGMELASVCHLRAPPPTPVDPFSTPPQTPIRDALSAIGNSPRSASSSLRRQRVKKEMKIVQVFGPEAATAARNYVAAGSVVHW
ncbi:hypothetical protein DFH07DRAFT_968721 [Mycena maculata]|uniref:Uncharacterized protein n=1 Tax=Mycena maculata TaxID=230809 RepID=A0AAD7HZ01_9AGAR|nr:hypothetical protein DFH07DRAFT_968721 [Mycena maculata]